MTNGSKPHSGARSPAARLLAAVRDPAAARRRSPAAEGCSRASAEEGASRAPAAEGRSRARRSIGRSPDRGRSSAAERRSPSGRAARPAAGQAASIRGFSDVATWIRALLANPAGSDRRLVRRTSQLFAGLILYGISMAFMVESGLGLTSWDVFHQGVSEATGISFGLMVILTGIPILMLWIPLRQKPGFGTIANLVVIGFVVDAALAVLTPGESMAMRVTYLAVGILLNAVATAMYIGARFGPGPRDGLMTGIVNRYPRLTIRLVRTIIEVAVLAVGFLLGGTVGLGTVAYALGIGPLVQVFMSAFAVKPRTEAVPAPA